MKLKMHIILGVIMFSLGYYTAGQYMSKSTEKVVNDKVEIITETETTKPGGVKVVERKIVKRVKETAKKRTIIKPVQNQWAVNVQAGLKGHKFQDVGYRIGVYKHVFSNAYIGAYGDSSGEIGIGVLITF